ncbi:enterochelin esterase [Brenneria sp. 4F2]|nr:enterochelin esterase [Brenneria bubanii]
MSSPRQAGTAASLLSASDAGTDAWWRQVARFGAPLIEALNAERVRVTFFWRDPAGDEGCSPIRRVYVDVNGITDHHSYSPQSLRRLAGTDVWHWSTDVERRWRGSYCLLPITAEQLPPRFSDEAAEGSRQQREWWCSLLAGAIADPLNPATAHTAWDGGSQSAAHMPDAPSQSAWRAFDTGVAPPPGHDRLHPLCWRSSLLGNERRIWLYAAGDTRHPAQRPLIIVLDGQRWAEQLPLFSAVDMQTADGALPPAVWLLIDAIDPRARGEELPCNARFWQAVQQELLPLAASHAAFTTEAARTVVAGQSYGGLAAMYAGLFWPQRFGRVLTQSGSFWWPNLQWIADFDGKEQHEPGWLVGQAGQQKTPAPMVIFQEAGDRERDIEYVNRQMFQALTRAGHRVHFRIYAGGHDAVCWRGGLIDGVCWLLAQE